MRIKRSQEAYILIDHRNSPGITPEFARKTGTPCVGAGETFESAMIVCCHCGSDVILNPDRSREREWCRICDAYSCDSCALALKLDEPHKTAWQRMTELYEASLKTRK